MNDFLLRHFAAVEAMQQELLETVATAFADVPLISFLEPSLEDDVAAEVFVWIVRTLRDRLRAQALEFLLWEGEEATPQVEEETNRLIGLFIDFYAARIRLILHNATADIIMRQQVAEAQGLDFAAMLSAASTDLDSALSGIKTRAEKAVLAAGEQMVYSATAALPFPNNRELTWVSVQDKAICRDCGKRHGETHTLQEWMSLGMPRTGWSVCGDNCRCLLVLVDAFAKNIFAPVVRPRGAK